MAANARNSLPGYPFEGTAGDDELFGAYGPAEIYGRAGDDTIHGSNNNDVLGGGAGDDVIIYDWYDFDVHEIRGGSGFDTIRTGPSGSSFGSWYLYLSEISSIERLELTSAGEIRAFESQIFGHGGAMKLEVSGSTSPSGAPEGANVLTIGAEGGRMDASRLGLLNWDDQDSVQLWGDAGADTITGSDYVDVLIGFQGDDLLRGGLGDDGLKGLEGHDTLVGGLGDDTYLYQAEDVIVEREDGGVDSVESGESAVLARNVENLTLYGSDDVSGTGNGGANVILGAEGANRLTGGRGADTLTGGAGEDAFVFDAPVADAADVITDFAPTIDKISLAAAVFRGLEPGALDPDAFRLGTAAIDATDRILYDTATGDLFFDRDGSADRFQLLKFATLEGAPVTTAGDFIIV